MHKSSTRLEVSKRPTVVQSGIIYPIYRNSPRAGGHTTTDEDLNDEERAPEYITNTETTGGATV